MLRLLIAALSLSTATAFVPTHPAVHAPTTACYSKKDSGDEVVNQHAFAVGTFVEFVEKKRTHIGKIEKSEHKSSGGARYQVIDSEGHKFNVADKHVLYSMPCPNSPGQATKLYDEFCAAQDTPVASLEKAIDVSAELLEMAWEEAADEEEGSHSLTAASFVELVQGHAASAMEKYMAWKYLQSDVSHIFFKEIKSNGRVTSFKAKTRKAVDNAKDMFCRTHQDDNEICFV